MAPMGPLVIRDFKEIRDNLALRVNQDPLEALELLGPLVLLVVLVVLDPMDSLVQQDLVDRQGPQEQPVNLGPQDQPDRPDLMVMWVPQGR